MKNFNYKIMNGLITYLKNEDVITIELNETIKINENWKSLNLFQPWYDLLVGGYSTTFDQIEDLLLCKKTYATRNALLVGIGSCGISKFDALPMTLELMKHDNTNFDFIIDIGCGDGSFLIDLCKNELTVKGIGLDVSTTSISYGNKLAKDIGIYDRVEFKKHKMGFLPNIDKEKKICVIAAFLLQEILEQNGEAGVIELLTLIFNYYPEASLIVIEVDNKFKNDTIYNDMLAKSYYNPYYLIHVLTEQRLETLDYWHKIFNQCNLIVKRIVHPDDEYDSLKLKTGFLIQKK